MHHPSNAIRKQAKCKNTSIIHNKQCEPNQIMTAHIYGYHIIMNYESSFINCILLPSQYSSDKVKP